MNETEEHPLDGLKEQLRLLSEKRHSTAMLFYASGNIDYYKASSFCEFYATSPALKISIY